MSELARMKASDMQGFGCPSNTLHPPLQMIGYRGYKLEFDKDGNLLLIATHEKMKDKYQPDLAAYVRDHEGILKHCLKEHLEMHKND